MREFIIPLSEYERLDDAYEQIRNIRDSFPLAKQSLTLRDKARGVVNNDGVIQQFLGELPL